ncbi:NAD(P)-dependent oxidoreductase [Glycomyces buryatensis]|uniref:NAD(P)-dependent oxidoreductase n=1 Tax=Glycomyces buryatensis TaxID=2570927 RepID=A0A4S8PQQ2_9ACTN|nr:NAD(P)H-binding protein [Glycomyces buryatensis]THV33437.1 NAD(P)-dependent oxidoreductase [Glycomyces buryatensis]
MKLTIAAATGATGRLVLSGALSAGHDVTALVRSPGKLPAGTPAVQADLSNPDPAALAEALAGADAVVSALGATSKAEAGVATRGTGALIEAMQATGCARLVALSAAPIGTFPSPARPDKPRTEPNASALDKLGMAIVKRVLREHYEDLAAMEDLIMDSGLDWTIVRPPQLTDKPATGAYRTVEGAMPRGGIKIARADVAHAMLAALADPASSRRVLGVAN